MTDLDSCISLYSQEKHNEILKVKDDRLQSWDNRSWLIFHHLLHTWLFKPRAISPTTKNQIYYIWPNLRLS